MFNMHSLVRVDCFLTMFISWMHVKSTATQEDLSRIFNYVQDIDDEIDSDTPLLVTWQKLTLEREYESIFGMIHNNADDLKDPQSDFEKVLRAIPNNDAKGLFALLFGVYGDRLLWAHGVLSRVASLRAFNATSFAYGANYTMRDMGGMAHGKQMHAYLANMLGRLDVSVLARHRKDSYSFDIVERAYAGETLPPNNLVMAVMPYEDNIRTRMYLHILRTRDVAYAPIMHYMSMTEGTGGKAAYYMAKSLGAEFEPPKRPPLSNAETDLLWQWFHGNASDEQLDARFEEVLGNNEGLFKHMVRNCMGIGVPGKIRITSRRYLKILRLAKHQDRSRGLIGPFIIKDSPFIGIKLTRRDYDSGRTKKQN